MNANNMENNDRKPMLPGNKDVFYPGRPSDSEMPLWYGEMLNDIKSLVRHSRTKAVTAANAEMIMMYYKIGRMILARQEQEGWGTKVIDRLSCDLKELFPGQQGFSPRNLKYMQKFAATYPNELIVQRSVAQLSWRHNILLITKIKEPNRRLLYAAKSLEYGWSHNMLAIHIDAMTVERNASAKTNFQLTLPDYDSYMVRYLFKDPYLLDFEGIDRDVREKALEDALCTHITKFLLELGKGFAFVGRQVHVELGGEDFYIDMLFYHLQLRRYVVIEPKAVDFDPGMISKLGMYQTIVDRTLKHSDDQPTIGLLMVKSKNETLVRYSLDGYKLPMGVSSWIPEIDEVLREKFASTLPTIEEIEHEMSKGLGDNNK